MAIIRPFKALRPIPEKAAEVASVPYDVVNRAEAFEQAKNYPHSFLRITRSEIELPEEVDPYSDIVYQKAKENLERISKEAPLIVEEKPSFYLYRLIMGKQKQTGIVATFSVDDYKNNVTLKHEKTRKDKEDDRTRHIITTRAQTGVVFLTYKGRESINQIVSNVCDKNNPLFDFTANDGIRHTIWILPEEYNQTIISEIAQVDKLYIADGHHRAASAARACDEMKRNNPNHNGEEEYNYFIATLFPAEELKILPYNRVVFDLNGLNKKEFLERVKEYFDVEKVNFAEPKEKRTICMYIDKEWHILRPNDKVKPSAGVGDNLDVSILQNYLLKPILGIEDPRTSKRIDFIGGIRGTKELVKLVDSGTAAVAFSMYPVAVQDLMNISDAGEIMPPKSTWFEPKLRDGLLTHLI
jgi:uncharacterized protein (DUF1015 family)